MADSLGLLVNQDRRALTHVSGQTASSGDNELVAAPGVGKRIVVTAFVIQGESTTATTLLLKDGSSAVCWRLLAVDQGDGLSKEFPVGQDWRLSENKALVLNLSGANACGYSVAYFTEDV